VNAHTTPAADPELVTRILELPDVARCQLLQIIIDRMDLDGSAEHSADIFLADLAWNVCDGDEHRASDLYPKGCVDRETWLRHSVECARSVVAAERQVAGRAAMYAALPNISGASFHGEKWGG
jgi:hypothetical protein